MGKSSFILSLNSPPSANWFVSNHTIASSIFLSTGVNFSPSFSSFVMFLMLYKTLHKLSRIGAIPDVSLDTKSRRRPPFIDDSKRFSELCS
ncbi:unnamed protein product [Lactuca virosa]|uniref:Uncharacterized protein n=1 Tax=Lactuca virosa TaxID=75947 RepID=A0AAU9LWZ8_9ASTR|nr:unnamed protein product [Lactuca virosa]